MTGIALPGRDKLPPGPRRDLVEALHELYRQAGLPGTRTISKESRNRDDLPTTISHEGISGILRGDGLSRWFKIECLVRILVDHAVGHPDVEATVGRIHELWLSAVDGSTKVEPAQVQPSAAHLIETAEDPHALELDDGEELRRWMRAQVLPFPPAPLSDEQRQQARHAATEARRRRADVKQTLRSGERSLADVLDLAETDDVIAHAKVIDVLKALPQVGNVRAIKVMERLDIAANRRLRGLGKHQSAALLAEFPDTYAANELARLDKRADTGDEAGPAAALSTEVEQSTGPPAAEIEPEAGFSVTEVRRVWPDVLLEVKAKRRFTWLLLSRTAQVADLRNGTLLLVMSSADGRDAFVRGGNEDVLREALLAVMGVEFAIKTSVVDPGRRFEAEDVRRLLWSEVLEKVRAKRHFTWFLLSQNAQVADVRNGTLVLIMSSAAARDAFFRDGNEDVLREAMVQVTGAEFVIKTMVDEPM
jgi:hypothetical protein